MRSRFEDFRAALSKEVETDAGVKVDGQVDGVAGDEAAAVGEEEDGVD